MKIRILVAVAADGSWESQAAGWGGKLPSKKDTAEFFHTLADWQHTCNVAPPVRYVWVEADIALPEPMAVISGKALEVEP